MKGQLHLSFSELPTYKSTPELSPYGLCNHVAHAGLFYRRRNPSLGITSTINNGNAQTGQEGSNLHPLSALPLGRASACVDYEVDPIRWTVFGSFEERVFCHVGGPNPV